MTRHSLIQNKIHIIIHTFSCLYQSTDDMADRVDLKKGHRGKCLMVCARTCTTHPACLEANKAFRHPITPCSCPGFGAPISVATCRRTRSRRIPSGVIVILRLTAPSASDFRSSIQSNFGCETTHDGVETVRCVPCV